MRVGPALATLALVGIAMVAEGASLTLDDRAIEAAVAVGESSVNRETFGDEWRVRNQAGHVLMVMTPFHRVALAARHAGFRKEPLKPRELQRTAKEQRDRLVLWLDLRGPREDFARVYAPRLTVDDRQVEPSFVQNEHTAKRASEGSGFIARCVYTFPTKPITSTSKVTLLVRDGDGKQVTSFPIDLGAMR